MKTGGLAYSSTLKMLTCSAETSDNFQQTTRHYISGLNRLTAARVLRGNNSYVLYCLTFAVQCNAKKLQVINKLTRRQPSVAHLFIHSKVGLVRSPKAPAVV